MNGKEGQGASLGETVIGIRKNPKGAHGLRIMPSHEQVGHLQMPCNTNRRRINADVRTSWNYRKKKEPERTLRAEPSLCFQRAFILFGCNMNGQEYNSCGLFVEPI